MSISANAKIAGILGWPVGHSLSPRLHGYWLAQHRIDGGYIPLPVRPEDFELGFKALPKLGFAGGNVTIPHKEAAFRLCDRRDDAAQAIGAVNTLVIGGDGKIEGRNSDGVGFWQALVAGSGRADWFGAKALLLGAGGAGRAVAWALGRAGVDLIIANRDLERARRLAEQFGGVAVAWQDREAALAGCDLLVNSTSLGMTGKPDLALGLDGFNGLVFDLVYAPLQTRLLHDAGSRGLVGLNGLEMLMHQGVPGFAAWFGVKPEVDDGLRAHLLAWLQQ